MVTHTPATDLMSLPILRFMRMLEAAHRTIEKNRTK